MSEGDQIQGDDGEEPCGCADIVPPDGAIVRVCPIINRRGLHARASAKFVQCAEEFDAQITVCRGGETVGATSIMGLMMLAAGPGTSITMTGLGPQAAEALEALAALVADKFGEGE